MFSVARYTEISSTTPIHSWDCNLLSTPLVHCTRVHCTRGVLITYPTHCMDDFAQSSFHQPNPKYLGHKLQMRFEIKDKGKFEWFNGQILNFNPKTGEYGAFIPSDGQTVYINPSQEADDIVFYKINRHAH